MYLEPISSKELYILIQKFKLGGYEDLEMITMPSFAIIVSENHRMHTCVVMVQHPVPASYSVSSCRQLQANFVKILLIDT